MSSRHLLPLLLLALAAAPDASAQFKWRDANGRMVYSDMPPPASVAPSSVVDAPARPTSGDGPGGSGATASAPAAASPQRGPGTAPTGAADRELEFRKRRLEKAESERKAADAAAKAQRRAGVCEDSRSALRTLESGARIARVNERGEQEYLDDAQRARRIEAARETAREACGA
jgi:hypothetical protein